MKAFLYIFSFIFFCDAALAGSTKIGHWRLESSESICSMDYNGWGKNIELSYLNVPTTGLVGPSIDIYGILLENDLGCWGSLEIYAPYSKRKEAFYYNCEASYYKGYGLVSSVDDEEANLDTLFRFLHVIGGGGLFTLTHRTYKEKIASFTLNGNKKAVQSMYHCLRKMGL